MTDNSAVVKGGGAEYIKKPSKTDTVVNRSIDDQRIRRHLTISAQTDRILDALALIYGVERGEVVDMIARLTAVSYNLAVSIKNEKPDLAEIIVYNR